MAAPGRKNCGRFGQLVFEVLAMGCAQLGSNRKSGAP
jgi:hypothetical protein